MGRETRWLSPRNMTQGKVAPASCTLKYQCPERGKLRVAISPTTCTWPKSERRVSRMRWVRPVTERVVSLMEPAYPEGPPLRAPLGLAK